MKIILGLGNPGVEYANTRHNAGILLVDNFSQKLSSPYGWRREKNKFIFKSDKFTLIKTASVFMNESGNLVKDFQYLTPDPSPNLGEGSLFVVHDDLDIKLGEYKIQKGMGPKVHNGVLSVENKLKTKDFWRIRIGIDNRTTPIDGETYVLQKFSPDERKILDSVFEEICKKLI
ncbi:aminoacyl-tRNA hydrolase [Candidatus Amesbacteria bacterium]|nr:aminoacyl-tRNA hydrolase [Candidatus Amesbacteria bacterium]